MSGAFPQPVRKVADLIAMAFDVMLGLGFRQGDFVVRPGDCNVRPDFPEKAGAAAEHFPPLLAQGV